MITLPYLQYFSKEEKWWHDGPTTRYGKFMITEKDMTKEVRDCFQQFASADLKVKQKGRHQHIIRHVTIMSEQVTWTPEGLVYEYTFTW